jgi:hypothetical protein
MYCELFSHFTFLHKENGSTSFLDSSPSLRPSLVSVSASPLTVYHHAAAPSPLKHLLAGTIPPDLAPLSAGPGHGSHLSKHQRIN